MLSILRVTTLLKIHPKETIKDGSNIQKNELTALFIKENNLNTYSS